MLKKSISVLMALLMVVSVFGISFSAVADTADEEPTRYSVISNCTYEISVSGLKATCTGSLTAQYSTTVKIKLELQKKSSGTYSTVKTWEDSKTGRSIALTGSKVINPLSDYRLKATFTAGSETVTRYAYP